MGGGVRWIVGGLVEGYGEMRWFVGTPWVGMGCWSGLWGHNRWVWGDGVVNGEILAGRREMEWFMGTLQVGMGRWVGLWGHHG